MIGFYWKDQLNGWSFFNGEYSVFLVARILENMIKNPPKFP